MREQLNSRDSISLLVHNLVKYGYSELMDWSIQVNVGHIRSFGDVSWSFKTRSAKIRVNNNVLKWPNPAMVGLLAHELSHSIVGWQKPIEYNTDSDVIERGLGIYLAFERAYVGRYKDDTLKKRDKYLGFITIRERLPRESEVVLERLLGDFGLIPQNQPLMQFRHDTAQLISN